MTATHALIIDDKPSNIEILRQMLELSGATTTPVTDPSLAAATLDELEHLDVVFLDLEMPQLTGYDLLSVFKTHNRFGGVPVVAYTVHTSEINIAREMGFDSFLGKPINIDDFPAHLEKILNGESVWIVP